MYINATDKENMRLDSTLGTLIYSLVEYGDVVKVLIHTASSSAAYESYTFKSFGFHVF